MAPNALEKRHFLVSLRVITGHTTWSSHRRQGLVKFVCRRACIVGLPLSAGDRTWPTGRNDRSP
ncbi:hypothetical protein YM304_23270 [Ilumatobacter coccineus YM16-304]|uniref:Uncharacterized protein n=1 Tax=Ilumatobacter coccineus (strain NBRC 103263 / KCTC 29153 / YM16-304) TaxID=1313172 RepID=A0A6C7E849_ILUCY|nr:hypothetical protein YM304_23270 [Ilumatobacter coccineus YM16-304]